MEGCLESVIVITDHQPLVRLMDQPVLIRVQTRWLRLGLFQSIRSTIKYQPRTANVVADALSRSQRTTTEDSTMELAKNNPNNEVYALTLVTVEPSEEEGNWHQAYLEDLSCCVPVEWCGTAQDGLRDDGSQTAKIKLT